jgi:peptidoglycan/xylan/chitin deacetylase (PgdA/CDA1 family)
MKYLITISILLLHQSAALAKEVALTFDDAPRESSFLSGNKRARLLLAALRDVNVPNVAFFVNTKKINKEGNDRIRMYAKNGHFIGNHSHSHPELNKVKAQLYIEDLSKADKDLSSYPNFTRWFRYPYLREGDTKEKRDQVREKLKELKYFNAYVTVNNYDWYIDTLFQKAITKKNKVNMNKLKDVYIGVLIASMDYYEDMAMKVLGRSPKHILLLHENDLAALFVKDLVIALRLRGWRIISPQEAYKDPISMYETSNVLPANPGRIGEIAKDKGWHGRNKLWHEACNENFLEKMFLEKGVYTY